MNKAFLTIHGLREVSEVVGHPLDQFVVPEDKRGGNRACAGKTARGESFC